MGMMLQGSKWLGSPPFKSHELVLPFIFASFFFRSFGRGPLGTTTITIVVIMAIYKGTPPNATPPKKQGPNKAALYKRN